MRLHALYLTAVAAALAIPLSEGAVSAPAYQPPLAGVEQAISAKKTCPAGWIWEPAGYMGNGHWRPAHCAPRNTLPF